MPHDPSDEWFVEYCAKYRADYLPELCGLLKEAGFVPSSFIPGLGFRDKENRHYSLGAAECLAILEIIKFHKEKQ